LLIKYYEQNLKFKIKNHKNFVEEVCQINLTYNLDRLWQKNLKNSFIIILECKTIITYLKITHRIFLTWKLRIFNDFFLFGFLLQLTVHFSYAILYIQLSIFNLMNHFFIILKLHYLDLTDCI
jgi:hypothetical protein